MFRRFGQIDTLPVDTVGSIRQTIIRAPFHIQHNGTRFARSALSCRRRNIYRIYIFHRTSALTLLDELAVPAHRHRKYCVKIQQLPGPKAQKLCVCTI